MALFPWLGQEHAAVDPWYRIPGSLRGPGVVEVKGYYFYFQRCVNHVLQHVVSIAGWPTVGTLPTGFGQAMPPAYGVVGKGLWLQHALTFSLDAHAHGPQITLVSIAANGSPLQPGRYDQRGAGFTGGANLLALLMPASALDAGHVEWIAYSGILADLVDGMGGFFIDPGGFASTSSNHGRGTDRTVIAQ